MRARIVAYVTADSRIGLGHAVRLGALLRAFAEETEILAVADPAWVAPHFPPRTRFVPATPAGWADHMAASGRGDRRTTVLLADVPNASITGWSEDAEVLTVRIDDHGGAGVAADIVVNQSDLDGAIPYPDVPRHGRVLRGLPYVMLREPFAAAHDTTAPRRGVGIVIGSGQRSAAWAHALVKEFDPAGLQPVDFVLSPTVADFADLESSARVRAMTVSTGLDAATMRNFYASHALCITTGGMSLFEAMASGAATVSLPILDDMLHEADVLQSMGAIVVLPRSEAAPGRIEPFIAPLWNDREKLDALRRRALQAVDGRGSARICRLIARTLARMSDGAAKADALTAAWRELAEGS